MKIKKDAKSEVVEGMRARKARQTRERIANTAMTLFLERGFDGVTVDEIAATADVSKRSFFDYFPTKEEVIFAWQDGFGTTLAEAVRSRPAKEPLAVVVEEALTSVLDATIIARPQGIAFERMVQNTPALRERDRLKYFGLEQILADSLLERVHDEAGRLRVRMLAVIVIGALRVANEEWHLRKNSDSSKAHTYTRQVFEMLWSDLREFGKTARKTRPR